MSHFIGGNLESVGMAKCPNLALTHAGFSRPEEGTGWGMILPALPQVYVYTHTHTQNFINIFMNILLRSSKILVSLRTLIAAPSPCYLSLSSVPAHPIKDGKMLLPCPNVLHTVTIPNCKR